MIIDYCVWLSHTHPHSVEILKTEKNPARVSVPGRTHCVFSLLLFQPCSDICKQPFLYISTYSSYHHAVCSFPETRFNDSWTKQSFAQTITRL